MVDRLAALLGHFAVSARTFQAGALCGINSLDGKDPYGQLHTWGNRLGNGAMRS